MNINFLAGQSVTDLYALLQQDNWGLGAAEGLAHYNGQTWRWVGRIDSGSDFVADVQRYEEAILLLTACGQVHCYTPGSGLRVGDDIFVADLIEATSDLLDVSIQAGRVHPDGRLTLVGSRGAVFHRTDGWSKVPTGAQNDLYCITDGRPHAHVAGTDVAMSFDGKRCLHRVIVSGTTILAADELPDGRWVGGAVRSRDGLLIYFSPDNEVLDELPLGPPVQSVLVVDDSILVTLSGRGVHRWDGQRLIPSLTPDMSPGRLYQFDNQVVVGGGTGGPNSLFVLAGDRWDEIPIDLDMKYLDRK